jgi:anti-sigma regulatory factor (Ser/Thr protein kinase)
VGATTAHGEFTVDATARNVGAVRRRVGDLAAAAGIEDESLDAIRLCVTEAVANAIVHAYGCKQGTVDVAVEDDGDHLVVAVRDHGVGMFAPRQPERRVGFGLQLIERLSERCSIASNAVDGTEVRMWFPLPAQPAHA